MAMSNYDYWRMRLEEVAGCRPPSPSQPGDAGCGFWRYQVHGGEWVGVAVWPVADGSMLATRHRAGQISGYGIDPDEVLRYGWKHPVTEAAFRAFIETGRWPDDIGPGHNAPDGTDTLADEVASAVAAALSEIKGGIADQTGADRAANFKNRLTDVAKKVTAEHKTRKAPSLAAGRAVDAEYKPLVEKLEQATAMIRSALTAYMRKVEQAARAATPDAAEVKVHAGTQGQHTVALRTVRTAEITDWPKAVLGLVDHPDVRELVQRIANAQARAGTAEGIGWKADETKVAA